MYELVQDTGQTGVTHHILLEDGVERARSIHLDDMERLHRYLLGPPPGRDPRTVKLLARVRGWELPIVQDDSQAMMETRINAIRILRDVVGDAPEVTIDVVA